MKQISSLISMCVLAASLSLLWNCGPGLPQDPDSGPTDVTPASTCPTALPSTIKVDLTIPAGCIVPAPKGASVTDNATLTIEAGAQIRFAAGQSLYIGLSTAGRLVVNGTAQAPVRLTSDNANPGPSDWRGLHFSMKTMEGTSIEHAVIEYAGHQNTAAMNFGFQFPPQVVSVRHTSIQSNAAGAVFSNSNSPVFAVFDNNTLKNNGDWSVRVPPEVIHTFATNNLLDAPLVIVGQQVMQDTTWHNFSQPYIIEKALSVGAPGEGATLTIAEGVTVKVALGVRIYVGTLTNQPGGLVAKGVTFTSAAKTPSKGDWEGIWFQDRTLTSRLENCTIEYGGGREGVIQIWRKAFDRVAIIGSAFEHSASEGNLYLRVEPDNACTKYTQAAPPNQFDLSQACRRH